MKTDGENPDLAVLALADYAKKFTAGDAGAYLIVNKKMQEYPCMFGFTKMSENFADSEKLFMQIEEKARELGCKQIIGPLNYTTWLSYRWAIDHLDMEIYPDCNNPLFYVEQIKKVGLSRALYLS